MVGASLQLEAVASDPQFRHLSSIAGIAVDLRYATPDNFVGRDLYSPIACVMTGGLAALMTC